MAKNSETPKSRFAKLAKTKPVLPVISDHPLADDNAFEDSFQLCHCLGPVFDIIRHAKTPTPTAIAIYGDWGTGKTSAMKWLEALISHWNEHGKDDHKTKVQTVWFCPWKYHDKDDVWRGLISEVILKGIEIKGANVKRVTKAAKQFGLFLGKSFLHTLAALKLKAGATGAGEAEFDLSCIRDVLAEYDKNIHPEKAFLNEFETSFEQWLASTLDKNERMVIFIDDLDRCMPQVALRVLEALKLYLNIPKLIFVVGVDKNVINPLVKKHYADIGLTEYKSDNYLAKMFQTEVSVGPSEDQVVNYLDYHLAKVEYFKPPYLEVPETKLFRDLINDLADRNPREVKRLINSALMSGAGVEMMKQAGSDETNFSFKQGLQVFFIKKILEEQHDMPRLLGSVRGNSFFSEWSNIVCAHSGDKDFPRNLKVPQDYYLRLREARADQSEGSLDEVSERMKKRARLESIPDTPKVYRALIKNPEYSGLLTLLSDERLGKLMQIEFSAEIAEITQEAEPVPVANGDAAIIFSAIAKKLGTEAEGLSQVQLDSVRALDLAGRNISDLSFLKQCRNLVKLVLIGNQISDISPLGQLIHMKELDLAYNRITDVSCLSRLIDMKQLDLDSNQIVDISSLSLLESLTYLDLTDNPIRDISCLCSLRKLELLYIERCKQIPDEQFADLEAALPELKIAR